MVLAFRVLLLASIASASPDHCQPIGEASCPARAHSLLHLKQAQVADAQITLSSEAWSKITTAKFEIGVLFFLFVAGILGGHVVEYVPKQMLGCAGCALYVFMSCLIDITIARQKTSLDAATYTFEPACTVLLVEAMKFILSAGLHIFSSTKSSEPHTRMTFHDVKWMCLPMMLFTLNNILVWQALGKNDIVTFSVFRDTMIIWTAIFWRGIFQVPLGHVRWLAIGLVFLGLTINRLSNFYSLHTWTWAFLWILLMTFCNAMGSVSNEWALKRNAGLSINMQNMVLYAGCFSFTLVFIAITHPEKLAGFGSFFRGFSLDIFVLACLQSVTGLVVSRALKYADSVMKNVAACLRGPIVALIGPVIFNFSSEAGSVTSALVVAMGCLLYFTQGPIVSTKK